MSHNNREFWRGESNAKQEIYTIAVDKIHIEEGWQDREIGDLSGFEASLEELGINGVSPITAVTKNGLIYVREGHHRLLAARNVIARGIPLEGLRVIPESKTTTDQDHVSRIFTSNQGKPLTVLETVDVLRRLIDFAWSPQKICKRLGLSSSYVSRLQHLIGIPEELKAAIKADIVSASVAIDAIANKKLEELLEQIRSTEAESGESDGSGSQASSRKKPKISGASLSGKVTPAKAVKLLKEQDIKHLANDTVVIEMPTEVYRQIFGTEE